LNDSALFFRGNYLSLTALKTTHDSSAPTLKSG